MNKITGLTDAPAQIFTLPIQDGSTATLTISYRAQQFGWFYDLVWNGQGNTFNLLGRRLVNFPNILRQYRNQIPFGIWCSVPDGGEPTYPNDFSSGRVGLYLLAPADVAEVESRFF